MLAVLLLTLALVMTGGMIFSIFMLFRNNFTFKVRMRWNEAGYVYAGTQKGWIGDWMEPIQDYNWIMWRFWRWDIGDFKRAGHEEMYEKILPYYETQKR